MAPKLTLTYFDFAGLAEPIRMALAVSGLEWEDKRLTREEFGALKPTLPHEQLPILEVDDKVLPQSNAQLRYVGKLAGLYPSDDLEAAFVDATVDCVIDNHMHLRPTLMAKDEALKMEMRKDFAENFLVKWLGNMEKNLKKAGGVYFVGNKLSIGDLVVVCRLLWFKMGVLDGIPATCVDDYPLLSALVELVTSEPKIAAYNNAKVTIQ